MKVFYEWLNGLKFGAFERVVAFVMALVFVALLAIHAAAIGQVAQWSDGQMGLFWFNVFLVMRYMVWQYMKKYEAWIKGKLRIKK